MFLRSSSIPSVTAPTGFVASTGIADQTHDHMDRYIIPQDVRDTTHAMAAMSYDNSMFATTVSPVDELFAPSSPTTSEWHEEGIDDGYEADDESIAGTRPTPTNNASGQEDRSYWRPNQYTRAGAYESVYGIPRANPELDPERPWWEMLPDAEMHRTITAAIQHETSFDQLPPDLGVWMLRSLPADILGCFDMRVRHERVSATPPTASILTPTNRPIFDPDMIKGIYWATIAHSGWPFDELSKGTRHWVMTLFPRSMAYLGINPVTGRQVRPQHDRSLPDEHSLTESNLDWNFVGQGEHVPRPYRFGTELAEQQFGDDADAFFAEQDIQDGDRGRASSDAEPIESDADYFFANQDSQRDDHGQAAAEAERFEHDADAFFAD